MTPAPGSPAAAPAPPLRERKKQRTRQALIDTALTLFTRRGFGSVTLDELCAEVEVSKRTFFRYFSSKEDVAMAPHQDLWLAFRDGLEGWEPDGRPLLEMMRDVLLTALDRTADEGWTRRAVLSHRLALRTPSMDAHSLHFCEHTMDAVLEIVHRTLELDAPDDPRPRLAGDMLLSAHRYALTAWAAQAGEAAEPLAAEIPGKEELAARVREAFNALPGSLTLTAVPRRT